MIVGSNTSPSRSFYDKNIFNADIININESMSKTKERTMIPDEIITTNKHEIVWVIQMEDDLTENKEIKNHVISDVSAMNEPEDKIR
jgi:hypothetical protein